MPCSDHVALQATSQGHGTARQGYGMTCELTTAVSRQPVGHLPSFGFFRLPRGVTRRLFWQRLSVTNWTAAEFYQERSRHWWGEADCFCPRTRYWSNIFKTMSVLFPYTHDFLVSISSSTVKCWDCDGATVFSVTLSSTLRSFLGYCATHTQPRLFCLRLQDSVEFGHKITYIFSENAESILNNSAWQSVVVHFIALIVPGWNSRVRSEQIYRFRGNASSPTISKGRCSSLVGGGLELGILSASASRDFPKIDLLKVHHLICRIHQHQLFTYSILFYLPV